VYLIDGASCAAIQRSNNLLALLARLVREWFPSRRKFTKLVSNHLLRDCYGLVRLSVVNHEFGAYKVGEDGARSGLRVDWNIPLYGLAQIRKCNKIGTLPG